MNLYSLKQDCCRAKFHGPAKDVTQVNLVASLADWEGMVFGKHFF